MRNKNHARSAKECLLKAKMANSHTEKMGWLSLAQSWLQLADAASITRRDREARMTGDGFKISKNYALTGHS